MEKDKKQAAIAFNIIFQSLDKSVKKGMFDMIEVNSLFNSLMFIKSLLDKQFADDQTTAPKNEA